jgi:hypothetical protein
MPPLAAADWSLIPDFLRYSMRAYVERGRVPGAFLTSILANDGYEILTRAPKLSMAELSAIIQFCHRYLPPECFGSPERVADWEHYGGLAGLTKISDSGELRHG